MGVERPASFSFRVSAVDSVQSTAAVDCSQSSCTGIPGAQLQSKIKRLQGDAARGCQNAVCALELGCWCCRVLLHSWYPNYISTLGEVNEHWIPHSSLSVGGGAWQDFGREPRCGKFRNIFKKWWVKKEYRHIMGMYWEYTVGSWNMYYIYFI